MKHIDDASWLPRLQEGNLQAFKYFFLQYYKPLCLKASLMLGDIASAETLVQQVFREVWLRKEYRKMTVPVADFFYLRVHVACEMALSETTITNMQLSITN